MQPNSNVYGFPNEWISSQYNIGNVYFPSWGQLKDGVSQNKITLSDIIDQSIGYVGLGSESAYSNIISTDSLGHIVKDSRAVTNFFFSYGDLAYRYCLPNNTNANTWDVEQLAPDNYNGLLRPIVSFTPSKVLWWVLVTAASVPEPLYDYQVIGVRLYQYVQNLNNWRVDFPYIKAAYMVPAFDISTTETPNRLTSGNSINISINERRNIYNKDNFITFTDLSLVPIPAILPAHTVRQGILLRGSREGLADNFQSATRCAYFLGDESCIVHSEGVYTYSEEYSEAVIEEIVKEAACFCCPFVADIPLPDNYTINDVPLTDSCVYWGYPDANGVSHGEYTRGADNTNNPVYSWNNTTDSDYDYRKIPSDYDYTNHFNHVSVANFNKYYVMNYNEVKALAREVYEALSHKPSGVTSEEYSIDTFFTSSPIDGIIKILRYPLIEVPNSGSSEYIKIGAYTSTTLQARAYVNTTTPFYNFVFSGSKKLNEAFGGSFLDREPYTTAELTIPFCGTVPIAVSDYIGHTITVKLAIDFKTGSCTAYILKDNTPLQSANGQIGIDIPITGISSATIDSQLMHANLQLKSAQNAVKSASYGFLTAPASMAASVAGGGKFGVAQAAQGIGGLLNTGIAFEEAWNAREAASYDLHHIQPQYKQIAAGSPTTAAMGEYCCRLTIYRPILSDDYDASIYGHTIGYATLENNSLSYYTGFTAAANADLSGIAATAAEKAQISDLLKSGIYI